MLNVVFRHALGIVCLCLCLAACKSKIVDQEVAGKVNDAVGVEVQGDEKAAETPNVEGEQNAASKSNLPSDLTDEQQNAPYELTQDDKGLRAIVDEWGKKFIDKRTESVAKLDGDSAMIVKTLMQSVRNDLYVHEKRRSQALDVLVQNCQNFPSYCERFVGIMRDKVTLDLMIDANIFANNLIENEQSLDVFPVILAMETYNVVGLRYLDFQKDRSRFPFVTEAVDSLKNLRSQGTWTLDDAQLEKQIFMIYAAYKAVLEVYADGIWLIADGDDNEVDKVSDYWSDAELQLIPDFYGDLVSSLDSLGLTFATQRGDIEKAE